MSGLVAESRPGCTRNSRVLVTTRDVEFLCPWRVRSRTFMAKHSKFIFLTILSSIFELPDGGGTGFSSHGVTVTFSANWVVRCWKYSKPIISRQFAGHGRRECLGLHQQFCVLMKMSRTRSTTKSTYSHISTMMHPNRVYGATP